MKTYFKYILVLIALGLCLSCSVENLEPDFSTKQDSNTVTVVGRVTGFKDHDVETRGPKDGSETKVSSLAMAIFEVSENGIGDCVAYDFFPKDPSLTFSFQRNNIKPNTPYAIYMFANMPGLDTFSGKALTEIKLENLLKLSLTVKDVDIPGDGFPMVGSLGDKYSTNDDKDGNLLILLPQEGTTTSNPKVTKYDKDGNFTSEEELQMLTIPMKAMYAKINFSIIVDPKQTVEGNYPPQFTITGYSINNVPNRVDFYKGGDSDNSVINDPIPGKPIVGNTSSSSEQQKIEFSFYLPERLLTPQYDITNYPYPFVTIGENNERVIRAEDEKYLQRYKGKLLGAGQLGTNVEIIGTYRDHQNHSYNITYTIHLGENANDDFNILRNKEYNNNITIAGIEASSTGKEDGEDGENGKVFIDHRVDIEHTQPAIITLHREVLLDSHFEIRPLRIKKNPSDEEALINSGAEYIRVEVLEPGTTKWMRIERSGGVGTSNANMTNNNGESIYINEDNAGPSKGKRRYFTYNLVNGLATDGITQDTSNGSLVNSTSVEVPLNEGDQCVWIYVDEVDPSLDTDPNKANTIGDGVRSGQIKVTYLDSNKEDLQNSNYPPVVYTINQRKLFEVTNSSRTYHIEYHEEYLHNYDSDDNYGQTQYGGMKWGLMGEQLSYDNDALYFTIGNWGAISDIADGIINAIKGFAGVQPKYDYYIPKHDTGVPNDTKKRAYRGYVFSQEIIQEINYLYGKDREQEDLTKDIDILSLSQQPNSAIEYCFNKNKRNADGHVVWESQGGSYDQSQLNWYLPAIDEIEDIVMSDYISEGTTLKTYGRFLDFQGQYYWSSQPAYIRNYAHYTIYSDVPGSYYYDDTERARATKVVYNEGNNRYDYEYSGTVGYYHALRIYNRIFDPKYEIIETGEYDDQILGSINYQPGNKSRNDMARVRCVRKSAYTNTSFE